MTRRIPTWAYLLLDVVLILLLWAACEGLARSYSTDPFVKCHAPAPLYFKCKAITP